MPYADNKTDIMIQTNTPKKKSFQDRFLLRILEHLMGDVEASGLVLRQGDSEIFSVGSPGDTAKEIFDFEGYTLFLHKYPGSVITTRDRSFIKSARELIALTLPSIRRITRTSADQREEVLDRAAGLPLNTWVDSLLNLLNTLSLRSDLLRYYEKILHLNEKILLAQDLNSVLQIITDTAKEVVNAEGASLLLVDHDTGEMFFNVISGGNNPELKEMRIPRGKGIAGDVAARRKGEIIHDVSADGRVFQDVDERLHNKTRDMIAVPLMARNSVIGVFEAINSASGGFRDEDMEFLSNIGLHTGLLLENARSREGLVNANRDLDRNNSELGSLFEIGKSLKSTMDIEELKDEFLRTLMRMLKVKRASIMESSRSKMDLRGALSYEMTEHGLEKLEAMPEFTDIADIMTWMSANNEPFFFSKKNDADEGGGLIRRFFEKNQAAMNPNDSPDVWIPVFRADARDILFVVSLSGYVTPRKDHASEMIFFGSIMDQARMAFYTAETYWRAVESREKEENLRQTFQKYVPGRVVEDILEQTENPKPRKQTATILFLDIRNFTGISEQLDPAVIVELLNEFFEDVVEAVSAHGGVVDKFIGDAIMAIFGVPDATSKDADNAVRAAVEITERLKILNARREKAGRICFDIGIGIHTGDVIVGNIGSRRRMDYTAIGDTVNLTSRLQKASSHYGVPFIFTESTLKTFSEERTVREMDLIQVKGRTSINRIFQMAESEDAAKKFRETQPVWMNALDEYKNKNFNRALELFETVKNSMGRDPVCELYRERCLENIKNPPEKGWDGIFRLDS